MTVAGRESIEPCSYQGLERLGERKVVEITDEPVPAVALLELAAGDEHPHELDCIEGDTGGARYDRRHRLVGNPWNHPRHQGRHRRVRKRREMHRHEVAPPRTPAGIGFQQFRPSQGHHENGVARRTLDQVGDEVEQSGVGPMQVFEHERGRAPIGNVMEEGSDGGEQFLAVSTGSIFEPEQRRQARLEPAAVFFGGHVLGDGGAQLDPALGGVVGIGDPGSTTDHLAQRPHRQALAVGR